MQDGMTFRCRTQLLRAASIALVSLPFLISARPLHSEILCSSSEPIASQHPLAQIIEIFVDEKLPEVAQLGYLGPEFPVAPDISFFICPNRDLGANMLISRDPPSIYLSESLLSLFFVQSMAYILGAYASRSNDGADQFDLLTQVALNLKGVDDLSKYNWIKAIEDLAVELYSVDRDEVLAWESDSKYDDRQTTAFSTTLYFLIFHEICHLILNHDRQSGQQPEAAVSRERELAADRCAIDIIDQDEYGRGGSPVSFYGLSFTVLAQILAEARTIQPANHGQDSSHPSPADRLDAGYMAASQNLKSLSSDPKVEPYQQVLDAQYGYMRWLISEVAK